MSKQDEAVRGLVRLQRLSAVVFLILGVLTVWLMKAVRYPWAVGHLTNDALLSPKQTAFTPAFHYLWNVPLWFLVCILLALAIIYNLLPSLTKFKPRYLKALRDQVMLHRWLGVGILGGVMLEIAGLLSGIQDISLLKLMAGLVVVAAILSWLAERNNRSARKPEWATYGLSLACVVLAWLPILASLVGTPVWGMVRASWYVYTLNLVLAVSFTGLFWMQARVYRHRSSSDYPKTEQRYLLLLNGTVALVVSLLIIGLHS